MRTKRIFLFTLIVALFISFPAGIKADDKEIFKDIKESDWFAENVFMLYKLGIINGKPQKDGTVIFDPKGLVTKAEFTKMLVEAMDYDLVDGNTFKDVGYDRHWAKKYIETAVKEGVINPADEGDKFWSDIPIKRNDMAYMMYKALKLEPSNNKSPFPDVDCGCITKLHEEYLINGIPQGKTNYFMPSGLTTRAETATIIARMVEYRVKPETYKENKIAEAKANEFVEPEFEVRKSQKKILLAEIHIKNYADFNDDYNFKSEFISHPQLNKTWSTGLWGLPVELDYSEGWYTNKSLTYYEGQVGYIESGPYYLDKAMKKSFQAKPGMVFDMKITIKKGEKSKEYIVPVEIPQ